MNFNFRKLKSILALVLVCANIFGISVFAKEDTSREFDFVERLFGYASEMYIDESITQDMIFKSAIEGYLKNNPDAMEEILKEGFGSLDEYSDYYTSEEFYDYLTTMNHTFFGIGVVIQLDGDKIKVIETMEGGSAFDAGILAGDYIIKANDENLTGMGIEYAQSKITGELNTEVKITVLRDNKEIEFSMIRRPVNDASTAYIIIDEETAYVSMISFSQNTANEFKKILDELDDEGITNIILDLRGNPGGYLDVAVDIAKLIVPRGKIVQTIYRQKEKNTTFYSELDNPKFKFAVLVNGGTASAAEILTGAIQDSGVGKVFGEQTFGKAVIQEMFNLTSSGAFKITTGRYLTRNGREINKIGLEPDFVVENGKKLVDVSKFREIEYNTHTSYGDIDENVSIIKERLAYLDYPVTDTNTYFDSLLEKFVLEFQIKHNLKPTGELDRITMVQIENEFALAYDIVDNQLYEAYEYFGGTKEKIDEVLGI